MKFVTCLLAPAALCIAGCGTAEPPKIPYSGGEPSMMQSALGECRQQAGLSASTVQDPAQRMATQRSLERECMERRGYVRR